MSIKDYDKQYEDIKKEIDFLKKDVSYDIDQEHAQIRKTLIASKELELEKLIMSQIPF